MKKYKARVGDLLVRPVVLLLFYFVFFLAIHLVLYRKIGAFGCFDDCPNIMVGWFLLKGRVLYEQIFYNHQPLIAYLSAIIQNFTKPQTIYQLIVYHRLFVYLFSFLFGTLIVLRFRITGVLFLLFYESTKYYFFGDRFLAEALLIYPTVFLFGVLWEAFRKRQYISQNDLLIGTIFAWMIVFLREPYVPLALFLYVFLLVKTEKTQSRLISLLVFGFLTIFLFLFFPLGDFYFNVVTVNSQFHLQRSFTPLEGVTLFFYTVAIFLYGKVTSLRFFEISLSVAFFVLIFLSLKQKMPFRLIMFLLVALGLANLRFEEPGLMFYKSFHMLCWYSLFLFSIFLLLFTLKDKMGRMFQICIGALLLSLGTFLFWPGSYLSEKTDSSVFFFLGYNQYFTTGELVKRLSTPSETLFLDGWNDLIYWQAQRISPYPYSWYTSIMPGFERYTKARELLLARTPSDFFYGACKEWPFSKVSAKFLSRYKHVLFHFYPTCLYIRTPIASQLSKNDIKNMEERGYTLLGK